MAWPDGNDYIQAYLMAKDPKSIIDGIEGLLGLPTVHHLSPTSPTVLTYRLIAGLMERIAITRDALWVRSGWYDSSGNQGCSIRRELQESFAIQLGIDPRADWRAKAQTASRYWLIYGEKADQAEKLKALVDLDGFVYWADNKESPMLVWDIYQKHGRDIERIVSDVLSRIL